jgi:predicted negative regulator of RcsB-dependent stress response
MQHPKSPVLIRWAAGTLLTLAAVGCANQPLKSDKLLLAREAVEQLTSMGGNTYAPAEMQAARERIDFARTALAAGDLGRADTLSDESLVNTRLAQTRIQSAKAQKAATELGLDRRALQIELQNNIK